MHKHTSCLLVEPSFVSVSQTDVHQVRSKLISRDTAKGGRRQSRQKKRWEDNIGKWTGLEFAKSQESSGEQSKMAETGCEVICGVPATLAVKG